MRCYDVLTLLIWVLYDMLEAMWKALWCDPNDMILDRIWDVMMFNFTDMSPLCEIFYDVIQMMWFWLWCRGCSLWYTVDVISVLLYDVWCDVLLCDDNRLNKKR